MVLCFGTDGLDPRPLRGTRSELRGVRHQLWKGDATTSQNMEASRHVPGALLPCLRTLTRPEQHKVLQWAEGNGTCVDQVIDGWVRAEEPRSASRCARGGPRRIRKKQKEW